MKTLPSNVTMAVGREASINSELLMTAEVMVSPQDNRPYVAIKLIPKVLNIDENH